MALDVLYLQRPWSGPHNFLRMFVELVGAGKKYTIGVSLDGDEVLVLLQTTTKTRSSTSRRRKRRICHRIKVNDELEAMKQIAHHCHRKLHKQKEKYKLETVFGANTSEKVQLNHLLQLKPCQVPFSVDKVRPGTVDLIDYLDGLEIE